MSVPILKNISNRRDGDRFIPRRSLANIDVAHYNLTNPSNIYTSNQKTDIFSQTPIWEGARLYADRLKSTVNFTDSRIIKITDVSSKIDMTVSIKSNWQWPVHHPRKCPLIEEPTITLDLPSASSNIGANIMDWSSTDRIATIYGGTIFLWNNPNNEVEAITSMKMRVERALKWNNAGTELAFAGQNNISILSIDSQRVVYKSKCTCSPICGISAITWDNTGRLIATGCDKGILSKFNLHDHQLHSIRAHVDSITTLKLAKANKFLCSSGTDCRIRIWRWPSLIAYFELTSISPVRAIEFHPWRDSLLAVGAGINDGSISVWNLNNYMRKTTMTPEKDSFVDCFAWNSISGELVSSHQIIDKENLTCETKILVLSSINEVVDIIGSDIGRVQCMLWNPNNTQIATAESAEVLNIWNFFGNKQKNYFIESKYINKPKGFKNFYKCIR